MRVLRILGNTIRRRFVTVVLAVGCCLGLWKDNEKWDDDCVWLDGPGPCDDLWYNNEIWDNNEIWPICD